jgi:hypothetical protein
MSPVIDHDLIEAVGKLLREHTKIQNELLVEILREYKKAQFSALEEALTAHLKAQDEMVDRLLERLGALFRAPGEPEAGQRRLDS